MPTIKLYAKLRKLAGTKELSVTGSTVVAALNELLRQHPLLDESILEDGRLRPHIVVTLNGHNVIDLNASVTEQDVIAVFPPIAGGTSPRTPLRKGEGRSGEDNVWLV